MAKTLTYFAFLFFSTVAAAVGDGHTFSRNLSPESLDLKREKLSHLHFYFHDVITGPNPTVVRVAEAALQVGGKSSRNVRSGLAEGICGVFRYARGYVEARTYSFNVKSGDAVVEYNVYAFHY
ncbi:unnamed protein product, partial [Vitis vinifera]